jgi:hypothetical protein
MKKFSLSKPAATSVTNNTAHRMAWMKLDTGPASATQIMSRFGWRSRPKFTGTGLA